MCVCVYVFPCVFASQSSATRKTRRNVSRTNKPGGEVPSDNLFPGASVSRSFGKSAERFFVLTEVTRESRVILVMRKASNPGTRIKAELPKRSTMLSWDN